MTPIAVYVHVPFCAKRCGYCDFNTFALSGELVDRTVEATIRDIEQSPAAGRPAKTVFFGGGTPTRLSAQQLQELLHAVRRVHPWEDSIEVSSEANPSSSDHAKFAAMREAGFNRLSIGAQSFSPEELRQLGRNHAPADIVQAVRAARAAGFENLNLDLMLGLPNQTSNQLEANIRYALELKPEHLSIYGLTIEPNTRFFRYHQRGLLALPGEEAEVAMLSRAAEIAEDGGYARYEISNFSQPGRECEHNLCYWHAEEYAGYGPGAVGRIGRIRRTKIKSPERFCEAIEQGQPSHFESEELTDETLNAERIMLGLRLRAGIHQQEVTLDPVGLARAEGSGWIEPGEGRIRLTDAGRMLCNEVTALLLP